MKKLYYLAISAVVAICLSSCVTESPEYKLADIQGLWQRTNTQEYVRFTNELSSEAPYYLGCEWNEAEDVHESDLIESRNTLGHPGDGWFKYDLKTSGTLTEIHLMDNEGAEIPKVYIVSKLNATSLEYYERERPSNKFSFSRK